MGILQGPEDTVCKLISMPRWQREWVNKHGTINFSGLCQEMITELIRQKDPKYFNEHQGETKSLKKDVIGVIMKKHPEIIPNI